jgi:hypothetical protein
MDARMMLDARFSAGLKLSLFWRWRKKARKKVAMQEGILTFRASRKIKRRTLARGVIDFRDENDKRVQSNCQPPLISEQVKISRSTYFTVCAWDVCLNMMSFRANAD